MKVQGIAVHLGVHVRYYCLPVVLTVTDSLDSRLLDPEWGSHNYLSSSWNWQMPLLDTELSQRGARRAGFSWFLSMSCPSYIPI